MEVFWDVAVRIECCRALYSDDQQCCIINQCTFSLAIQDVPFTGGVYTCAVCVLAWLMYEHYISSLHACKRIARERADALLAHWLRAIRSWITLKATVVSTLTLTARTTLRHRALSVIDYVAFDRFTDFKHATCSFKLCRTGRTVWVCLIHCSVRLCVCLQCEQREWQCGRTPAFSQDVTFKRSRDAFFKSWTILNLTRRLKTQRNARLTHAYSE